MEEEIGVAGQGVGGVGSGEKPWEVCGGGGQERG